MLIAFVNPKQELTNKIKIKSGNLVSHSEKIHNELASLLNDTFYFNKGTSYLFLLLKDINY